MSRRLTGQADGQAGSRNTAAQGHGWLGGPVTRSRHIAASAGCSLPPMPWYDTVPSGISLRRGLRGGAPLATADDYQRHYETEVSGHLRAVSGFRGARLLRRDDGPEI